MDNKESIIVVDEQNNSCIFSCEEDEISIKPLMDDDMLNSIEYVLNTENVIVLIKILQHWVDNKTLPEVD